MPKPIETRRLRRFIIFMVILLVVSSLGSLLLASFGPEPRGDFQTKMGSNRLREGRAHEALEHFDRALAQSTQHRGALMGRALALAQDGRSDEALLAFTQMIAVLEARSAAAEDADSLDLGSLAAAYANRGILYDHSGRYQEALDDYSRSLALDFKAVDGPGLVHRLLYDQGRTSTVPARRRYLAQQLALPPTQRLLRVPKLDAQQRMHRP